MFDCQVITSRGGRFLEAPVAGSQQLSNDGMLVILAAGDKTVYEDCSSCFQAMGKTSFFLGMEHVLMCVIFPGQRCSFDDMNEQV